MKWFSTSQIMSVTQVFTVFTILFCVLCYNPEHIGLECRCVSLRSQMAMTLLGIIPTCSIWLGMVSHKPFYLQKKKFPRKSSLDFQSLICQDRTICHLPLSTFKIGLESKYLAISDSLLVDIV